MSDRPKALREAALAYARAVAAGEGETDAERRLQDVAIDFGAAFFHGTPLPRSTLPRAAQVALLKQEHRPVKPVGKPVMRLYRPDDAPPK